MLASLFWLASTPTASLGISASLVGLAVLALQFPLSVALTERISVATAVFFAVVLVFPVSQAALLVALASALSGVISMIRKFAADRHLPLSVAVPTILFNSAQSYLSALMAALVLAAFGTSAQTLSPRPTALVSLVLAGATMYALNLLLVGTAVAISTGRNPIRVFGSQQRTVLLQFGTLYLVGTATAVVAARAPLGLVLMVIPATIAYRSLIRRLELSQSAIKRVEQTADNVDRRDPHTFQHSRRVAEYSIAIALKLGLGPHQVNQLRIAAMVHDIGKLGIPDSILLKPGRLTDEERRQMELHPRLGYDYLADFAEYAEVRELVLTHHERCDGRGYPNATELIRLPLIARIMPVADSLDAMTSDRPYRKALSWEHALGELERGAGTQWDARVVAAAISCYRERAAKSAAAPQVLQPA